MPFIDEMRWNADERRFEGTLLDPAGVYSLLMRDARFDHGNAGACTTSDRTELTFDLT
jgi:hypothetical protein